MVRILTEKLFEYSDGAVRNRYIEAAGLSTDAKPVGNIVTGSSFLEVDTGKAYLFDEAANQWHEVGDSNA